VHCHLVTGSYSGVVAEWDEREPFDPCPHCGRNRTPDPLSHYVVTVEDAGALHDLVDASPLHLGSEAFVRWYEASALRGLAFAAVEGIESHRRVVVEGTARLADSSGISVTEECPECGRRIYSVEGPWALDEATWDGSAFFQFEGREGLLVCTDDAREELNSADLTGAEFQDISEVAL
jgi:predicted RNA-binding Zn-ribbon protein involved in translation (DUF1610 family)